MTEERLFGLHISIVSYYSVVFEVGVWRSVDYARVRMWRHVSSGGHWYVEIRPAPGPG